MTAIKCKRCLKLLIIGIDSTHRDSSNVTDKTDVIPKYYDVDCDKASAGKSVNCGKKVKACTEFAAITMFTINSRYAPLTPFRQTVRRPLQSSVVRFSQNRSDRKYERPFTPSPSSVIHRQSKSVRERF